MYRFYVAILRINPLLDIVYMYTPDNTIGKNTYV